MTFLFVVNGAPYPPRSGSPLRSWQNINLLADYGPVHVFSIGTKEVDASMPRTASWTHVSSDEFSLRSASIIESLKRAFWPRQYPIENDYITAELNKRLGEQVRKIRPDVVIVSHWKTAFPDALRPSKFLVADTHNVESEMTSQLLSIAGDRSLRVRYRIFRSRLREATYLQKFDRIWATSPEDAVLLTTLSKGRRPVDVVPNALDLNSYATFQKARSRDPKAQCVVGFVGFFGHKPNADAAVTLARSIFPDIVSRGPSTRLLIVGANPTPAMLETTTDARITVTGRVSDIREYLAQIDVLVIPLESGSGTRFKILEAFACRIPVVSTPKGAEGLDVVSGRHIEICEPAEMATRTLELLADPERVARMTDAAFELVQTRYSWQALSRSVPTFLGGVPTGNVRRFVEG